MSKEPRNPQRLPEKRRQVFYFCKAEVDAGRTFPGPAAIAKFMGWNHATSARDCLDKLMTYDGLLTRQQLAPGQFEYRFTVCHPTPEHEKSA